MWKIIKEIIHGCLNRWKNDIPLYLLRNETNCNSFRVFFSHTAVSKLIFLIYIQQETESLTKGFFKTLLSSQPVFCLPIHGNNNCPIFSRFLWLFPMHLFHLMIEI
jgi:hypothetical protein